MEAQAIQTLTKILARRKLDTTVTAVGPGQYTIGSIKVALLSAGGATNRSVIDNAVEEHSKPLILISPSPPSKLVRAHMRNYVKDGVQLFHLKQLQFDILTHKKYGFPCRILTADEKSALLENLRVSSPMRLPRISFDDPYSLWLGAKPEDVLEFEIPSEAAGWSKKYRYCVLDVEESTEEANVEEE